LEIKIDSTKLTDAPYSVGTADAFEFDDEAILEQFLLELEHARPGSYLLSGYRGSGKTSFINRIVARLSNHLIVELNISKSITYPTLLKKIIRQLYLQFEQYKGKEKVSDKNFAADFKLLYDRTFHEITKSSSEDAKDESKTESKLEFDLKKLIPYLLILWSGGGIAYFNFTSWPLYIVLAIV
jgi:AAA+ ATPase superfamily predicted ATPase